MKLRASYWTWKIINGQMDVAKMPTAYLMLDGKCAYDCAYCTHARNSKTDGRFLSRIVWKEIETSCLLKFSVFRRVCLQVVNYPKAHQDALTVVTSLNDALSKSPEIRPLISVSTRVSNLKHVTKYFEAGVDNLGIALDVADPELFKRFRGGNFERTIELILEASKIFPGRITTHLIVGLGETDAQIFEIFKLLKTYGVEVALFAFTPVRGTRLEGNPAPSLSRYRKIQLLRFLIFESGVEPKISFDENGYITHLEMPPELTEEASRRAYLTSGCTYCTRPYYNDRPTSQELFNLFEEVTG
ncbi:radical SAM protein [Fervidobacterium thailandense]|uniref:Radical SAM protein n=1 Tax=Fervidobacterium thailandense TaxID=1008305 RepID=A0A1E3G1I0_9BACT|nr:radical SAM protein [Fervidobacterium thailandense]ODN29723.1 radical SAM protein [Fervidobacterium thailandense]